MRRAGVWLLLSMKRWLCHPGFFALLILIPVLSFGVSSLEPEETERIGIGVSAQGGGLGYETARELLAQEGMFAFVWYDSEEELKRAVQAREVECGYLFPDDLEEKLERGNYRRSIPVYTAPSTILEPVAGEVVFSVLAGRCDRVILEEYVEREEAFAGLSEGEKAQAGAWYEVFRSDGSTFGFEYGTLGGSAEEKAPVPAASVFPVRGILAVLLFLAAWASAYSLGTDERRGLFSALPCWERLGCRAAALAAPVLLLSLSCLAALLAVGQWRGVSEVFFMAAYAGCSLACAGAAKWVIRKPEGMAALIPFLALGLLAACPVFVDAERYWDGIRAVRAFLPTAWYLGWTA